MTSSHRYAIRAFDILIAGIGITIASPLLTIIFLWGLSDTGSPLFFQKRLGRAAKLFTLIKFRSMKVETLSVGTHLVDPQSITPLGKVLRKTKLDELPQLYNVLLGHMSIVGPRPCLPTQSVLISERGRRGIFMSRPGITGLAQICEIDMSAPRKLARYDQLMLKKMNIYLYLKILAATLCGKGSGDRTKNA